jgi:acyl dehydratase
MPLAHLQGTTFGPLSLRVSPEKVAEYVAVTRADGDRWVDHAPPSYAGALLFVATPELLSRDDVAEHTRVLIHADQKFSWHAPIAVGAPVEIVGEVSRVRSRGSISFVTFETAVVTAGGPVIESVSTFLLGTQPATEPGNRREPPIAAGTPWDPQWGSIHGVASTPVTRGASRLDLIRYAAASGDFNPIHFDHDAARGAGVDGIVVHGLLMAAWMLDVAAATSDRPDPLLNAKIRYRDPLYPAEAATLAGSIRSTSDDEVALDLDLSAGERRLVSAHATVRR